MLKPMTEQDIPAVIDLGRLMYQESKPYQRLTFSPCRIAEVGRHAIADGFAMVDVDIQGCLTAFMAGCLVQPAWSRDKMACDYVLYTSPLHRGSTISARLVQAYCSWARSRGASIITVGVTAGIDNDMAVTFYEAMGFRQSGIQLRMEV